MSVSNYSISHARCEGSSDFLCACCDLYNKGSASNPLYSIVRKCMQVL